MLSKGKKVETMTNVAATSTPGTITALMYDVVNHNWIVNTCASNHMVHNLSLLNQHQDLSDQGHLKVNFPTGVKSLSVMLVTL